MPNKKEEESITALYEKVGGTLPLTPTQQAEIERAEAESKEYMRYLAAGGDPMPDSKAPKGWGFSGEEPKQGSAIPFPGDPVAAPKKLDAPEPTAAPQLPVTQEAQPRTRVAVSRAQSFEINPFTPRNIDEAIRLAEFLVKSEMLPKAYLEGGQQKAMGRVMTATIYGSELGLSMGNSVQSIAVVNGVATLWGDTQKALVEGSGLCDYIQESYEPANEDVFTVDDKGNEIPNRRFTAVCTTKRKGRKDVVVEKFSVGDAIRAGIWGKSGPWKSHPKRMLRYKARSFALRDTYPDILKGLTHSREEMVGEGNMIDITETEGGVPSNPVEYAKEHGNGE